MKIKDMTVKLTDDTVLNTIVVIVNSFSGVRVDALQGEVYSALLAENARLREELDKAQQPTTVFTQILPVSRIIWLGLHLSLRFIMRF